MISLTGFMLVVGWCGAFRGEELPRTTLREMRGLFESAVNHPALPHAVICLNGRFKNCTGVMTWHHPLPLSTSSGIDIGVWVQRAVLSCGELGMSDGWVFRSEGSKGKLTKSKTADLDVLLHDILK